ncbi:lipopolysaccharide assembly protein LapB [Oceanobacillus sojae]|uniref:tetratricopeptide repeat protein n=1 Tax=Oceanobacillus sojae TaxID=582851 RepID=UPI0021A3DF02|nr:hypothetical protein [Oceanobacillus sojae]MCT1905333.1 hypothetical protein [Oceanobacillus sojae]
MKRKEGHYIKASSKGLKALEEGLFFYPDNVDLNRMMAEYYYNNRIWNQSVHYWEKVIAKQDYKPNIKDYINLAKALNKEKSYSRTIEIISELLMNGYRNPEAEYILAKTYSLNNDYKKAISAWEKVFRDNQFKAIEEDYIEISENYNKVQNYDKSVEILKKGLEKYESTTILSKLVEVTLLLQNWEESLKYFEKYKTLNKDKGEALEIDMQISMIQQLLGNYDDADQKLGDVLSGGINTEQLYRQLNIFNNGDTRIEFYKKLERNKKVIIVFDSINITWDRKPFAFKLLLRQDVDIIAVRKRKKSYLQDLSFGDFYSAVNTLVNGYEKKYAYGFSLGAYASIYYASKLNCKILALSPRLSIHPDFGKEIQKGKGFVHEREFQYNKDIEPIIVFDPKNKLDKNYINKGIKPYFPNAHFIESAYSGHGVAPHLLKMGLLKDFVIKFLQDEIPYYDKKLRGKSSSYYRVLGDACLKRNKPKWALSLVEHATYLEPDDNLNMRLKIHVLNRLQKHKEAVNFARYCKQIKKSDRTIRSLLIDSLVYMNDLKGAQKEIDEYMQKFGKTPGITKKEQELKANGLEQSSS